MDNVAHRADGGSREDAEEVYQCSLPGTEITAGVHAFGFVVVMVENRGRVTSPPGSFEDTGEWVLDLAGGKWPTMESGGEIFALFRGRGGKPERAGLKLVSSSTQYSYFGYGSDWPARHAFYDGTSVSGWR